jgi:maleylpyruvate isomerase
VVAIDPVRDLALVRLSADQLVHDVHLLDDSALAGASLLPGWTRAHVVGHLIGNADGLTRLLDGARTGHPTTMDDDAQQRQAGVEAAVGRPAQTLAAELRASIDRFVAMADGMGAEQWQTRVRLGPGGQGREISAAEVPWRRLVEQEVHNVDLAGAYTPAHWSDEFVHRLLDETAERYLRRDDVPALDLASVDGEWAAVTGAPAATRVEGPAPALLAWLTGRSGGEGLHVEPGPLPALPPWF